MITSIERQTMKKVYLRLLPLCVLRLPCRALEALTNDEPH
jgi:hypothetical protein